MAGAGPASAAPDDDSEALGQFLSGQVSGVDINDLVEIQSAFAENPSGVNPVAANPLSADVLNSLNVNLNESLQLLGPNGVLQLGAVNQYGEAQDTGDARAATGAVSDQGAISVGGSESFPANANLNLNPLLAGAGADGLVSDLSLNFGAVSSSAEQLGGGPVVTGYDVASATLSLSSPAIGAVYTDLLGTVEDVQGSLEGLPGSVSAALDSGIDLGSLANLSTVVELTPPDLSSTLPDAVIGESSGVTVDLATGAVTVELATLLAADPELPDLNALPANSELLTGPVVAAIADGITQAATDAVTTVVQNLEDTIGAAQLQVVANIDVILAGSAVVTLDASLDEVIAGETEGTSSVEIDGLLGGLLGLLELGSPDELRGLVLATVGGLLGETFDVLVDSEGVIDGVTGPLATEVVGPVLSIVNQLVGVTVNAQPAEGDLGAESTTVRALQLRLLPSEVGSLATVNLASSTVRGTNVEVPAFDTAITVDPSTVVQGGSTEVSGSGFAAEESVTVSIPGAAEGDDPITVETTTNGEGEFTVDLPIPADYPTGEVTVTAVGVESETPASAELIVTASDEDDAEFDTAITVDPSTVVQGGSTEVSGSGFAAEESVTVSIPGAAEGDDPITVETTTNGEGEFTVDLPIPADYPTGEVTVTAVGVESETPASAELIVAPAEDDAAADPDGAADAGADPDANMDASASASASADADADADPAAQAAAQAAATADADTTASADASASADADADPAAAAAAEAASDEDASTSASADADAASEAAAQAAATADADSEAAADASAAADPDAAAAASAAANADASSEASAAAASDADAAADPDGAADAGADPVANVDASASASASADADADADPAAQAAAQAAATADADTTASADASASADADADPAAAAAAEAASDEDASTSASADADATSEAAAQAAATADADSEAAADASAAADPDAAAAAQAAASSDASTEASGAADAGGAAADGEAEIDPTLTVQPDSVQPGDDVDIWAGGFVPGSTVTVVVTDSDGNVIGTIESVAVDQNGEFAVTWTVPEGTEAGELTFTATDDSNENISASATVTVTDGVGTAGGSTESDREDGFLAATGAAGIWLLAGLSALLLLGGAAALISRNRMSTTE